MQKRHEDELMKSTIEMLEGALTGVNESIAVTCKKLDALHNELKKLELA